ncbi:ribonuclease III [Candidatus Gottesmanbacteria bacterium]|nr:ribonuclease III [Candidatus Gottesmanbacteria bacterium]
MSFDTLEKTLGFGFKNQNLVKMAFIHRSYLNEAKENLESNERLEFLGDSILSFLVSKFLYTTYPHLPEGELTSLRSAIVKTKTLSQIASDLSLGTLLKLSKGEIASNGRENPSILADTFEALLGAIFLDQGLPKAEMAIKKFLLPQLTEIIALKAYKDAKSSLQEIIQEKTRSSPVYKVLQEKGPDHAKTFTIGVFLGDELLGKGVGKSKQEGEQMAAAVALEAWAKR